MELHDGNPGHGPLRNDSFHASTYWNLKKITMTLFGSRILDHGK